MMMVITTILIAAVPVMGENTTTIITPTEGNHSIAIVNGYPQYINISFDSTNNSIVIIDVKCDNAFDREEDFNISGVFYLNSTDDVMVPRALADYPVNMKFIQGSLPWILIDGSAETENNGLTGWIRQKIFPEEAHYLSLKEWAKEAGKNSGTTTLVLTRDNNKFEGV